MYDRSDFTLRFALSSAALPDYDTADTVGSVWRHSIRQSGLHVPDKAIRLLKLDLLAYVNYPKPKGEVITINDDDDEVYFLFY